MAKASNSISLDISVDEAWAAASDLARFDEWLILHDGWRGDVPGELSEKLKVTSVVSVKGARIRFDWVIDRYRPPVEIRLSGKGKGGIKATLDLAITASGTGSTVTLGIDLGGLPLIGPAGKAAAKAVEGDLAVSLQKFRQVFASEQ
ncbi:toxin [Gordonia pseudamarae]|jgi:hypothetical protein|uniref:Toxin n=1 Tax=Gordonia pseudamarae TaxID=2831662 RepID=A0ABX6IGM0_9ACTN|nr:MULTISPECIES: SRPBCC family protein [Gordonia]MBD0023661.1 SRPBCC family protein [Gordonia sp. (in: high G+C Gram-positive bacteria)]QHN25473.1 toxin [Gordonia pseudamarae]QHN34405.1 toxin [Gordonia pseudamarae]